MSTFVAQYHGACDRCGHDVKDTEVFYDMKNDLVHVECPADEAPRPICQRCFLELPVSGRCGNCE